MITRTYFGVRCDGHRDVETGNGQLQLQLQQRLGGAIGVYQAHAGATPIAWVVTSLAG